MKQIFFKLIALAATLMPMAAHAERGELIRPAQFGEVREVVGADLPIVTVRDNCPAAMRPLANGPCFDTVKATATPQRALVINTRYRAGDRLVGNYGSDFQIYEVRQGEKGLEARALSFATSDIHVPRDCYALNGQGIGYMIDTVAGAVVAQESQYVVCGGGPDRPSGPYQARGPVMRSDASGWGASEVKLAEGTHRYLALPDVACEPAYLVRKTYCAKPAALYMDAHPDLKELDLVAPKTAVLAGDIVDGKDIQQWVMKRQSKGYKADSRWFAKSMFSDGNGCWATEGVRWYVAPVSDGLDITEKAMSRCGAPPAPTPTALYEVLGESYFIVNCAWDRRGDNSGSACAAQARDYLKRERREQATVVVLNQPARVGDHLYSGGYVSYNVVIAELKGDAFRFKTDYSVPSVYESGCRETSSSDPQSKGFVIVRSLGISWARAYRWMDCNVY